MDGKALSRKEYLLRIISEIYLAVWEECPILVLGLCSMTTRLKKGVQREGTLQEDTRKGGLDVNEMLHYLTDLNEGMAA